LRQQLFITAPHCNELSPIIGLPSQGDAKVLLTGRQATLSLGLSHVSPYVPQDVREVLVDFLGTRLPHHADATVEVLAGHDEVILSLLHRTGLVQDELLILSLQQLQLISAGPAANDCLVLELLNLLIDECQLTLAQCRLPFKELHVKILDQSGTDLMAMIPFPLKPLLQLLKGCRLVVGTGLAETSTK
jgi:hypothetical protein